jgi:hypothetical protein
MTKKQLETFLIKSSFVGAQYDFILVERNAIVNDDCLR